MELAKEILSMFENFIKRSLMPSAVFFVLFMGIGFTTGEAQKSSFYMFFVEMLMKKENSFMELFAIVILFVGVSYLLSILMQMVYDNNIKKNYNTFLFWTDENRELDKLRKRVLNKIRADDTYKKAQITSDYMLYQLLSKKYGGSTSRYVDESKSFGIFFVSIILTSFYWLYISSYTEPFVLGMLLVVIIYLTGCDTIKTRYRSRAIRLYINYLIKKESICYKSCTLSTKYTTQDFKF
jgi:predicted membrane protein